MHQISCLVFCTAPKSRPCHPSLDHRNLVSQSNLFHHHLKLWDNNFMLGLSHENSQDNISLYWKTIMFFLVETSKLQCSENRGYVIENIIIYFNLKNNISFFDAYLKKADSFHHSQAKLGLALLSSQVSSLTNPAFCQQSNPTEVSHTGKYSQGRP